jgi:hypothetical protein
VREKGKILRKGELAGLADDFAKIENFLETLYVSGRLQLPLKGILLIGY